MRRYIYLDRIRRREILSGSLKDLEFFITIELDKKENNSNVLKDLLSQLYKDEIFIKLKGKLKNQNLYYYENSFVCVKCFQVYNFQA